MERYIRQDLIYQTRLYDLYQAFDYNTGQLKFYYEFKQRSDADSRFVIESETQFVNPTTKQTIVVSSIQPGGSLMHILQRQKQLHFTRALLLKWIGYLHTQLRNEQIKTPILDNVFVNTRLSQAYFIPNANVPLVGPSSRYISTLAVDFYQFRFLCSQLQKQLTFAYAPVNAPVPVPTFNAATASMSGLTAAASTMGTSMSAPVSNCTGAAICFGAGPGPHDKQQCDACKYIIALLKLYTDPTAQETRSLEEIFALCESDPQYAELVAFARTPHCRECCFVRPMQSQRSAPSSYIRVLLTREFLFGLSVCYILCNTLIPNFLGVIFALNRLECALDIDDLVPDFSALPDELVSLVRLYTTPGADLRAIGQHSELAKYCYQELPDVTVACEYKSRRSNTMTIVWTIGDRKINQYIVLDDSIDVVVDYFVKENGTCCNVPRDKLKECLVRNGQW